jgi:hypothetical protein
LGFDDASRLPLGGAEDIGDIELGYAGVMFQVKAGKAAEQASDEKIHSWLEITRVQAIRGRYEWGLLVTKRKGHGMTGGRVGGWWMHWFQGSIPVRARLEYLPELIDEEMI